MRKLTTAAVIALLLLAGLAAISNAKSQATPLNSSQAANQACPDGGYLQGMDKETGEPVCKPAGQTDPSQTNPKEARSPAQAAAQPAEGYQPLTPPEQSGFGGK